MALTAVDDNLVEGTRSGRRLRAPASTGLQRPEFDGQHDSSRQHLPARLPLVESGGSTSVTEGGPGDSITVALNAAPTAPVTVTVAVNGDVSISPLSLTFTPANWQTAQSVNLAAINDTLAEGDEIQGADPHHRQHGRRLQRPHQDRDDDGDRQRRAAAVQAPRPCSTSTTPPSTTAAIRPATA